jgi:hypothetical protein
MIHGVLGTQRKCKESHTVKSKVPRGKIRIPSGYYRMWSVIKQTLYMVSDVLTLVQQAAEG